MKLLIYFVLVSGYSYGVIRLPGNIETQFEQYKGCFLIKSIKSGEIAVFNKEQCQKRWKPCSTFKILNSLIGLESGVAKQDTIFKWDGKKKFFKSWEKDHNLESAIKVSAVPVYQELARRIGLERMSSYVRKTNYGNGNIGEKVDRFWLDGPLEINAYEQLSFMEKLFKGSLPYKKENIDFVKKIIFQKRLGAYSVSGKTGSDLENGKIVWGWFVGHVKSSEDEYVYVINIQGQDKAFGSKAKKISYKILQSMEL